MSDLKQLLYNRLLKIGVDENVIPGYIRCLANSIFLKPDMRLYQIRRHLEYMGWNDFDLDYHTFQLTKACLEMEGFDYFTYKPKNWFINTFLN